jgi:hypothetical protein
LFSYTGCDVLFRIMKHFSKPDMLICINQFPVFQYPSNQVSKKMLSSFPSFSKVWRLITNETLSLKRQITYTIKS